MGTARLDGIEPPTLGFEVQGAQKPATDLARLDALLPLTDEHHARLHALAADVAAGRISLAAAERLAVRR